MIRSAADQIAQLEAVIQTAAFRPVPEIPPILAGLVRSLESVRSRTSTLSFDERRELAERLRSFESGLVCFASAMRRSASIFEGYCRHTPLNSNEYTPSGVPAASRGPACVDLSF